MLTNSSSKYTISIDELLDNDFDLELNEYPIFDEEYRPILNNAIIEHFRFREIGFTNPAMFRNRLKARMNLIMRNKYNDLYKAKKIEFNPLFNVDMTETFTHEIDSDTKGKGNSSETSKTNSNGNNTSKGKNNNNSKDTNLVYNYPSEVLLENEVETSRFVSNANVVKSTGSSNNDTSETSKNESSGNVQTLNENSEQNNMKETYTRKQIGSSAGLPFSKAMLQLKQFYDKFELDRQVIDELEDLFITIY